MAQLKAGDKVELLDKSTGVILNVDGNKSTVKLDTGETIKVMNTMIKILQVVPGIIDLLKDLWRSIKKIVKK